MHIIIIVPLSKFNNNGLSYTNQFKPNKWYKKSYYQDKLIYEYYDKTLIYQPNVTQQ